MKIVESFTFPEATNIHDKGEQIILEETAIGNYVLYHMNIDGSIYWLTPSRSYSAALKAFEESVDIAKDLIQLRKMALSI